MHTVEITTSAQKELADFPQDIRNQIGNCIKRLAENPFPTQFKRLQGQNAYRVRTGDYRVLYSVSGNVVKILAVGNRKDIYRK